jgi:hypothetical protein
MKNGSLTTEHVIYLSIFGLAFTIRLLAASALPLSDHEAEFALEALAASRGELTPLGSQPGYALISAILFFIFGAGDLMARLMPMIVGSALVLVPFSFRHLLGRRTALLLAGALALDPVMIAVSAQAGSSGLAIGLGLLALAALAGGRSVFAGVLTAFALLAGPQLLLGAIGIAIAALAIRSMRKSLESIDRDPGAGLASIWPAQSIGTINRRTLLIAAGLTLLITGTLFLRYPSGLAALLNPALAFVSGWTKSSTVHPSQLINNFLVYQLFGLIFALAGLIRSWRETDNSSAVWLGRFLSLWFVSAWVVGMVYPARELDSLVWAIVPMWALAGLELNHHLFREPDDRPTWGLASLVLALLATVWFNLAGLAQSIPGESDYLLRLAIIGGAIALALLVSLLVGLGWGASKGRRGLVWGLGTFMVLWMIVGAWSSSQRLNTARLPAWQPVPLIGDYDLVENTLGDLGDWQTGRRDGLDIVVLVESPALRWQLREVPDVRYLSAVPQGETPSVIIGPAGFELALAAQYRGQDFVWWIYPDWAAIGPHQWLTWAMLREAPTRRTELILWGRMDLFPGGDLVLEDESDLEAADAEEIIPLEDALELPQP